MNNGLAIRDIVGISILFLVLAIFIGACTQKVLDKVAQHNENAHIVVTKHYDMKLEDKDGT